MCGRGRIILVQVLGSLTHDSNIVTERSLCVSDVVHGSSQAIVDIRADSSRDVHEA
jgi:hypothetical protein